MQEGIRQNWQVAEKFWYSNKFYLTRINIRMNQSHAGGNDMKSKMLIAILLGCLVWQPGVLSQTATDTTDTNQSISTSTANPPTAPAASTAVSTVATSSVAALTVVFPTSIATQPASQTAICGNSATFSVIAGGTPPLGYQWYFNGSAISDATAADYTIISVTASNAGSYTVVVTNVCGTVTSSEAVLTVVFPPSVTAQPTGQTVVNGANATFSVTAEGTPPLSYQWYFNGNAIDGATGADYTITGVTTNNEGNYMVVITNACGTVTSSNMTVVAAAPNPPEAAAAAGNEAAGAGTANPPAAAAVAANESPSAAAGNEAAGATTANPPAAAAVAANESPSAAAGNEAAGANAANPPAAAAVAANESASVAAGNATAGATTANPPAAAAVAANESPNATAGNATAGASAANPPAAAAAAANESASVAASNATAGASAANPPMAAATGTNESSSVTTSNATGSASSSTSPASAPASIPLIQFQDVPITTAIENLARQAGINYLLDPKIGYGQPDANGQVKPEPTLSIRWENITAGQALVALLDNYGLQLIEDHRTHIARITTKDPLAPPPLTTRVFQIKYASTSNMVSEVQAALTDKRSKVLPDLRTSQLIVVATDAENEAVDVLIKQLDQPTRQVLIETKLVEISSNPSAKKGLDWSSTLAAQNISFGNGLASASSTTLIPGAPVTTTTPAFGGHPATETTTTPKWSSSTIVDSLNQGASAPGGLALNTLSGLTPAIGFLNADGLHAVLSFLNSSLDAQIVSTPRIVTLDNESATISITRGYPVINVAYSTANVAGGTSITYSNIGTVLQVTPHISANDFIWLKVIPDVSTFFGTHDQLIGGSHYTADIFDIRHIETQVLIPNSNTLVLGGLVKDNPNAGYTKVPVLGDIPGLGWAFRSETKSLDKGNLLIFITPTIVREADFRPTTTDFLQSRTTTMKSPMNPNTMWDGAQPAGDWSNPVPTPGEFDKTPARAK
jgi:type II secretory pathway component GspD/PulD (secretin)